MQLRTLLSALIALLIISSNLSCHGVRRRSSIVGAWEIVQMSTAPVPMDSSRRLSSVTVAWNSRTMGHSLVRCQCRVYRRRRASTGPTKLMAMFLR